MEEYYCKQWSNKANSTLLLCLSLLKLKRKKKPKRFWQHDIYKRRRSQGAYHNLLQEMRLTDQEKYFNYLRMSCDTFNELLNIVGPKLKRLYWSRKPFSPSERLALTLRYLASGDNMDSMSYAFRIGASTVSHIIRETCNCIWDSLNQIILKQASEEVRLSVAKEFDERWQLPHCVCAIDGKHVIIQAPVKCGSSFFNYKGSHIIVPLAVCNANYQFTMVDIGGESRHSDGGIYRNSAIGTLMLTGALHLPPPAPLDDYEDSINYYIVADEAFPLSTTMMRSYPGRFLPQNERIFNYKFVN